MEAKNGEWKLPMSRSIRPMDDVPAWYEAGMSYVWQPYSQMKTARAPLAVVRTAGSRIVLADGRELVDGIASWWTACHGYNHPHLRAAIERQLAVMPHVMFGGIVHEQPLLLARRLAALLPGDLTRVFFSDSGSVAVEVAMKMAIQFWHNQGRSRRTKFIAFRGGYHGDTTGAMSICDLETGMHNLFAPLLPEHHLLDLPWDQESAAAFSRCLEQYADELAAIVVEPLVQGAGGMRFHDESVLRLLRRAADRYDLLLICDEIFTGFGRTGQMFACQSAEIVPDVITLSKALTGGTLPLAATVAREKIFDGFWSDDAAHALMHGPTFMANALGCAAANASLDLFEREPRLTQVAEIAAALERGLAPCRGMGRVKEVRVKGAIGVVELDRIDDLEGLRARFVEAGVFVRPFGSIVYLTPALTIAHEELATLTAAVVEVVGSL
jgi:adenosylmethionine---8-amino-7-oxononanoate aminotransferase